MEISPTSNENDASVRGKAERAYAELDKKLYESEEAFPAINVDGVRLYDVRQDGSEDWDEDGVSSRNISRDEARTVYDDILSDLNIDLSTDTDIPPKDEHFYMMADNVFADRIYAPPQYLHLAVDDLRVTDTEFTAAVDYLSEWAENQDLNVYLDNRQLPTSVDTGILDEPVESPENELYAEFSRRLDGNRPSGEHVVQKLRFEFPDPDDSRPLQNQLFMLMMEDDSDQGYYPLFTLPPGRYQGKKETTLGVVNLLEDRD